MARVRNDAISCGGYDPLWRNSITWHVSLALGDVCGLSPHAGGEFLARSLFPHSHDDLFPRQYRLALPLRNQLSSQQTPPALRARTKEGSGLRYNCGMAIRKRRMSTRGSRVGHAPLKHFFIPGPHNIYRPLFLRLESAVAMGAVVLLLFAIALAVERLVVKNPSPQFGAVVAAVLVDLANADRSAEGLPELAIDPTLETAAQMKADDMAEREYFAHETPEGFSPWHWFGQAGYGFRYAGENLAVYFSDSTEVEKAWMNSPLHRANILSDKYSEVGIAIAHGRYQGNETTFVVQMFGNPSETSRAVVSSTEPESAAAPVAGAPGEAQPPGATQNGP